MCLGQESHAEIVVHVLRRLAFRRLAFRAS